MAEGQARHKVARALSKRALAPLAQAAVTAGTAFLTRKAIQLWQEKLQPKVEQNRDARATEAERGRRKQRRDQRRRALEKSS